MLAWVATALVASVSSSSRLSRAVAARAAAREGGTGGMRLYSGLVGHVGAVYCCLCDRSGSRLITGSDDANIKIWSTETGLLQHTLRGHKGEITELAISPDNATLVSSSTDGTTSGSISLNHDLTAVNLAANANDTVKSVAPSPSSMVCRQTTR